jgi:hypothetical protein
VRQQLLQKIADPSLREILPISREDVSAELHRPQGVDAFTGERFLCARSRVGIHELEQAELVETFGKLTGTGWWRSATPEP